MHRGEDRAVTRGLDRNRRQEAMYSAKACESGRGEPSFASKKSEETASKWKDMEGMSSSDEECAEGVSKETVREGAWRSKYSEGVEHSMRRRSTPRGM